MIYRSVSGEVGVEGRRCWSVWDEVGVEGRRQPCPCFAFFPTLDEREKWGTGWEGRKTKPLLLCRIVGWLSSRALAPDPHVRILGPPHTGQRLWASVGSDLPESPRLDSSYLTVTVATASAQPLAPCLAHSSCTADVSSVSGVSSECQFKLTAFPAFPRVP